VIAIGGVNLDGIVLAPHRLRIYGRYRIMKTRPLLLMVTAALAFTMAHAWAQQPTPQATPSLTQLQGMSREERIKAHQQRIEQIIQENKRRQEEEARKAAEAARQQGQAGATPAPGAVRTGPLPPGPVQAYTPAQRGGAPAAPTAVIAPSAARSEARSLCYLRPFDSVVKPGDTFVTEIVANTKDAATDEFVITLSYPPQALNLLAVDFAPIAAWLQDEVEYAHDASEGILAFHARLQEPQKFPDRAIAICYWEALTPSDTAQIRFEFTDPYATDIRLRGQSILGTSTGRHDGVIHANILIRPRTQRNVVEKAEEGGLLVASSRVEIPTPSMRLRLSPPLVRVAAGDEFTIDVVLDNPAGDPFDRVQLFAQFDPAILAVIDADRGNWIRAGTNIEDGFAHTEFPFDFHKANRVDNDKGMIIYEEGCEITPLRSAGALARIHCRAKAAGIATISLIRNAEGALPTTNVTYLSRTVLADYPEDLATLAETKVRIGPASDQKIARRAKVLLPAGASY